MLLGFKRRFAPFVEEGSKTHTIRGKREIRPKVGETCHCYVDPRQKSMRLLGRFECVKVEDIRIDARYSRNECVGMRIWIEGERLTSDEVEAFAWRDGFRSTNSHAKEMGEFWLSTHRKSRKGRNLLRFNGDIIHWKYREGTKVAGGVGAWKKKRGLKRRRRAVAA